MTIAPYVAQVTFQNCYQPPGSRHFACSSQQQTNWEELAHQSDFRPCLLAQRCGVSLRTLERHFIKHYQIKVSEFLHKLRLSRAYTRLRNGEQIKCVSYDLGYKQPSHFSRDFKNFYGVPPRAVQPGLLQFSLPSPP